MEGRDFRLFALYDFKLGRKAAEAARLMHDAFGEAAPSERAVQKWYAGFRSGDESIDDKPRSSRSSECDDGRLRAAVEANPRLTCSELARDFHVAESTVWNRLTAMEKMWKLNQWVPRELNEPQMFQRLEICSSLILRNKNNPFLDQIFTCDEKWIPYGNRRRPARCLDNSEPSKQILKPDVYPKKIKVTVWWSALGLIQYSFLAADAPVTTQSYIRDLETAFQKLQIQKPALSNRRGGFILLHDNSKPYFGFATVQKLYQLGVEALLYPPYSPDLFPTEYHLFRSLDSFIAESHFREEGDVENAFRQFIESRSKDFFAKGISSLMSRWQQCVDHGGAYFE